MKFLLVISALVAVALTEQVKVVGETAVETTAYGYLMNYGVPAAEKRREAEEKYLSQRIVGGVPAAAGQYPWQAGLLIDLVGFDGSAVCGASLVSTNRLLTAAHCWYDGRNQAWRFTVVLGSVLLFSGGTRIETSAVVAHPSWSPSVIRNDIAMIYLSTPVSTSSTIAPVALPTGALLNDDFAGESAVASGFGLTSDGGSISTGQLLSHVRLNVITNSVCSWAFPLIIQASNICTSGVGGVGTCSGDSGGPLVVTKDNQNILVGVTSFGSGLGCETAFPAAFARVTSFTDFINQHL